MVRSHRFAVEACSAQFPVLMSTEVIFEQKQSFGELPVDRSGRPLGAQELSLSAHPAVLFPGVFPGLVGKSVDALSVRHGQASVQSPPHELWKSCSQKPWPFLIQWGA